MQRPLFLLGRGPRPRRLGAVLAALADLHADPAGAPANGLGTDRGQPLGLGDLEELLAQHPEDGTLILEADTVPAEDVGFVRRFLERHDGWRLLVLSDGPDDTAARLLRLPRASWLAWPPNLDQLELLLGAPRTKATASADDAPRRRDRRAPAADRRVEVGALLEERLAGAALAGEGAPNVKLACEPNLRVELERGRLESTFDSLLSVARLCAGPGGELAASATAGERGERVHVEVDFPSGPLTDGDLPVLLEGSFQGEPSLREAVQALHRAAAELRSAGGTLEVAPHEAGKLRFHVELPSKAEVTSSTDPFA